MDQRLVAWARAVKSRQRRRGFFGPAPAPRRLPVLWLFTDAGRLPDPLPAVARLPRFLAGVVLRHDGEAGRAKLGRALMRLCRARGLALSVAGDWRLAAALRAGLHLRQGRRPGRAPRYLRAFTSSAHDGAAARRARRQGALAFLSPAFSTGSHPGQPALGVLRWGLMARRGGVAGALGGIDGCCVRRLPGCHFAGAIAALG